MSDVAFTLDGVTFTYDSEKEAINKRKHGISFRTAAFVFQDTLRLDFPDVLHSTADESRWITIGLVQDILSVVYCEREKQGNTVFRLISARRATPKERSLYNDSIYGRLK